MTRIWPALIVQFPPAGGEAHGVTAVGVERAGAHSSDGLTTGSDRADAVDLRDLVSAELDGLDVVAIVEQTEHEWQVFLRDADARAQAALRLDACFGMRGLRVCELDVPDGDWARRSQAALVAIRVGALTVAPPWDAAAQTPSGGTIIIEPAMGFGSGHHATTRLCLAALQRVNLARRRVLDIGTGSGVLALAAARIGAGDVLGIDVDEDALENARTNAALNGHPPAVTFRSADFRQTVSPPADVVVANLTGAMLTASVPHLLRCCSRPGTLILSGITLEESEEVAEAFLPFCREKWRATEDGWCAFVYAVG